MATSSGVSSAALKKAVADIAASTLKGDSAAGEQAPTQRTEVRTRERVPNIEWEDVVIVRRGDQVVLPDGMTTDKAIEWLRRRDAEENRTVAVSEPIPGYVLDGAHAFFQALKKKFGFVGQIPTPGFFKDNPPELKAVTVDEKGSTVMIPWGRVVLPGIDGYLETGWQFVDGVVGFVLNGEVKKRHEAEVREIARLAREFQREHSIYRGKAIHLEFVPAQKMTSAWDGAPRFIDVGNVSPGELVLNDEVRDLLNTSVWTVIQKMDEVRAARIPIKRGILLHGKYGVGKTLFAAVTARLAVDSGVTFVEVGKYDQIPDAIRFARAHSPAVVFVEDVDRSDVDAKRTNTFNEILNTVDGLTSKHEELIVVFTTNHVEKISKAMLRPGRLDTVVEIEPPDAKSVEQLIRLYARHMLADDADLSDVGSILAGEIPAVVREVVERSKLGAISRGDSAHITASDLRVSAIGMRKHLELLKETPADNRSDIEKAAAIIGDALTPQTQVVPFPGPGGSGRIA